MVASFKKQLISIVEKLDDKFYHQGLEDIDTILKAEINSVSDLISSLPNEDLNENTREIICWFLPKLQDERALIPLLATLKDRKGDLRIAAAKALGELGNEQAIEPLINILEGDLDTEVRIAGSYALGLIGDSRGIEPMIKILRDQSQPPKLRGMVAEALSNIGDRRAVDPLILSLSDESVEVRFWASFALGELGDSKALPELERLAATDEMELAGWGTISREATEAIQQIKNKQDLSN